MADPVQRMGLPTRHHLRAAIQAAKVLDFETGISRQEARYAYTELPIGGIFQSRDLVIAEEILVAAGLIVHKGDQLFPVSELSSVITLTEPEALEALLLLLLEKQPPLWLRAAAVDGEIYSETIPDEESTLLGDAVPDLARREAILLAAAQRYDADRRETLGALGEEYVVEECRRELTEAGRLDLARRVRRTSLVSDQLGWDIDAPTLSSARRKLEVKTTRATGPSIKFHLSRNEARIGHQDPEWALVFCGANREDLVEVIGWCSMATVTPLLPSDRHHRGRWDSVVLTIDKDDLTRGLPSAGV